MRLLLLCLILLVGANFNVRAQRISLRSIDTSLLRTTFSPLPQNFYYQQLGIICKKECQLQNALKTNLFIRLGSKDYVDCLERKPNNYIGKRD
ncbi:MAG: hypothetical protein C4330_11185 [Chitinophagaceae bacterium]